MLELMLCSLFTLLPDYLFRRYVQGKRIGKEITFFSMWFELRWGIVTCLILAVSLITAIFYYHPATTSVISAFRSLPIVPQTNGRVAEIFVSGSEEVQAGQPLFRLDDETQRTAVEAARRAIAEVDAAAIVAQADLAQAEARILEADGSLRQARDELATKQELVRRANADVVTRREIERLQVLVQTRQAGVAAAIGAREAVAARISDQIPAQRATAVAQLAQADAELAKTVIRAGVAGRVLQFTLQVGDIVNPFMRPAGVLVPQGGGLRARGLVAGFPQIEAQVMRVGMTAEAVCISNPWTVIPLVVTDVQSVVAGGQIRAGETILDVAQFRQPGTILVVLEPLYAGGLDDVIQGSHCIANAYTSNHELLSQPGISTMQYITLHAIDTVGVVHAILLRIQALLLPFQALVFSDH